MSDLESKRCADKNCTTERRKLAKEIILRYLASPGNNSITLEKFSKFCPVLTGLDFIGGISDIEAVPGTISHMSDDDGSEVSWVLTGSAQKFETPEFFDAVSRGSLSGSILHDGAIYLALENEYQKKRRKF